MTRIKSITKARRIVPIEFRNQLLDNRRHGSVYRCLRSDRVSHRGDCAARDQFLNKVISTTDEFKAFLGKVDFTIGSVVQKELNDISIAIDDCEKKGGAAVKVHIVAVFDRLKGRGTETSLSPPDTAEFPVRFPRPESGGTIQRHNAGFPSDSR